MEFETLQLAAQGVQEFRAFTTQRTSIRQFYESSIALIEFVDNLLLDVNQNEQPLIPRDELLDHIRTIRFAFRTIHQRIRPRRCPVNLSQLWAYLGLPIRQVSSDLAVSVAVLRSRCRELNMAWPRHSDAERILVAVQKFDRDLGRVIDRKTFRFRRGLTFRQIHMRLRIQFDVAEQQRTAVYVEINGRRYGQLQNALQWDEVLAHDENVYRVNLLFVVS